MPLFAETKEQIFGDIINDIVDSTPITRISRGSKMRSLIEAISRKMGRMYSTFDVNYVQAFLDGAEGQYLDFFGNMMGVARLGAQPAVVTASDRNVKFVVDIGTFGDINSGASITITAGTIISTESDGEGIKYRVINDTVLASSDDEGYVSVESVRTGTNQNLGKNQLRFHNFTNYTDSTNGTLKVTNEADVINGGDIEIDTNYRYRIANQTLAAESANETSITLAALSVPGVADIVVMPFNRGIGTYDLLIESTTPSVSEGLVSSVNTAISQVSAYGIIYRARGPVELGLSMIGTLTYRRLLTAEEESSILQAATTNLTNYINSLDIGEEFVVQEALEQVLATSELIKKVGTTSKPFDKMYLYTPTNLEDGKVRSTIIDDYNPEGDERIIVENKYAGTTPILLRSA